MTDNEIIKALECCTVGTFACGNECPYYSSKSNLKVSSCMFDLMCEISNLINRQNAEIERLKQENKEYCEDNRIIAYQRNQRDKEIRALHNQLNGLNFMDKQIKSEAIKEFADRLKNEMRLEDDCQYDCMGCLYACKEYVPMIDNLVKEMTEIQGK